MGILEKSRFKENIPFEVKDFKDEPIGIMSRVKESFVTGPGPSSTFERESVFKTGFQNTFKSIQSK